MLSVDASHSCFAHMHCTERLKQGESNSSAGNDTSGVGTTGAPGAGAPVFMSSGTDTATLPPG